MTITLSPSKISELPSGMMVWLLRTMAATRRPSLKRRSFRGVLRKWVAAVAVKRRLPDAFEIRIRERIPAFWMLKDGVLHYADNRGRTIAPVSVGNFLSLPTLEILPGGEELLPQMDELSRAFQAAHLPVNMASVSLFRVSAAKGFEVFIENRNLVLCIAAEDWDTNLRRLSLVLSDLARRGELKTAREVWAADGNVWVVEPQDV